MAPVTGTLGATEFTTSLRHRQGTDAVPITDAVRHAEGSGLGDAVRVTLRLGR